jgi:hypothetical protein
LPDGTGGLDRIEMEVRRLPRIADDRRRDLRDVVRVRARPKPRQPQLAERAIPGKPPGVAKTSPVILSVVCCCEG